MESIFYLVPVAAVTALGFAWHFFRQMKKQDEGTDRMKAIAKHVREGAMSYLKQQYKMVTIVFVILAALFAVMAAFGLQNSWVPFAFLTGGFFSGLAGYFGMKTATYASARTAHAASKSLNKGLQGAVNIMWTQYEGAVIDQYTIWRGPSPDALTVLTTASGHETSYTDFTAPEGENMYYALSYSHVYETEWITYPTARSTHSSVRANAVAEGYSNRAATNEGVVATLPTSLAIRPLESEATLTPDQPVLHLLADLLPVTATIRQVRWSITAGDHLAQINDNGTLEYIGAGQDGAVTVMASTIDGSALTATLEVPVTGFNAPPTNMPAIDVPVSIVVYPNPVRNEQFVTGLNGEAILFNANGLLMIRTPLDGCTSFSVAHLPGGVYLLVLQDEAGQTVDRKKIVKM